MRKHGKPTDSINVVDVESTCWRGEPPKGQRSEIIQIGIAAVDVQGLRIKEAGSIYVKPIQSKVSAFCTELTGITQEILDEKGVSLQNACYQLREKYSSKEYAWASFGDYDRTMFLRESDRPERADCYPFGGRHLNVKTLAALVNGYPFEVGLKRAMGNLGVTFEGRYHDGGDDAKNIAKLLISMLGYPAAAASGGTTIPSDSNQVLP